MGGRFLLPGGSAARTARNPGLRIARHDSFSHTPMSLRRRPDHPVEPIYHPQSVDQPAVRDGPGDSVTSQVLRFIEERHLAPGDRLPSERELALRLNVSRPALRESLAALEAMRVIVRRRNSGIYLAAPGSHPSFESVVLRSDLGLTLDADTIRHSMEVRNLLELQAVDLACARRDAADLDHLESIIADTRARLAQERSIIDLDEAFHLGVVAASKNPIFAQIVHAFYRLSLVRRQVYFADLKRCQRSHREHQAILRAIRARDSDKARRAMHVHIHEGFWRSLLKHSARVP